MKTTVGLHLLLLMACFTAAACDDDTSSGADDSPCGQLAVQLCEQSCACAADCRIRFPSGGTQGFGNEIQTAWDQCTTAFTNSCKSEGLDVPVCETALASMSCDTSDPASPALQLVDECNP